MPITNYPADLPNPSGMTAQRVEGRERSRTNSPLTMRPKWNQRLYLQTLEFSLDPTQAAAWSVWWTTTLNYGGERFLAEWPSPLGWVLATCQFVNEPSWRHLRDGSYKVSVQCELLADSSEARIPSQVLYLDLFNGISLPLTSIEGQEYHPPDIALFGGYWDYNNAESFYIQTDGNGSAIGAWTNGLSIMTTRFWNNYGVYPTLTSGWKFQMDVTPAKVDYPSQDEEDSVYFTLFFSHASGDAPQGSVKIQLYSKTATEEGYIRLRIDPGGVDEQYPYAQNSQKRLVLLIEEDGVTLSVNGDVYDKVLANLPRLLNEGEFGISARELDGTDPKVDRIAILGNIQIPVFGTGFSWSFLALAYDETDYGVNADFDHFTEVGDVVYVEEEERIEITSGGALTTYFGLEEDRSFSNSFDINIRMRMDVYSQYYQMFQLKIVNAEDLGYTIRFTGVGETALGIDVYPLLYESDYGGLAGIFIDPTVYEDFFDLQIRFRQEEYFPDPYYAGQTIYYWSIEFFVNGESQGEPAGQYLPIPPRNPLNKVELLVENGATVSVQSASVENA